MRRDWIARYLQCSRGCDRSKRHSSCQRDRCKAASLSLLYRRRCENDGNCKGRRLDNITAEVCPHHFILTSDDIKCDDPNYKMNPPLRTKKM